MTNIRLLTLSVTLFTSLFALGQPIALHPSNPHYFTYKNKATVLITSGEHYGALMNLDFNYHKYLSELHAKGLNLTRTFSGVYCEQPGAFNIGQNTLAPASMKYITPWARSEQAGYKNGGNKFDLAKWDEAYFKRLKDYLAEANRQGVVVEFTLFCPFYEDNMWLLSPMNSINNVNGRTDMQRTDVYTLDKNDALLDIQKSLVKKLVTEVNGFDNVIFEICNEPYFGGVTIEWQHAIADVITQTENNLPNKHLISQNIQNGASLVTDPHPAVSVYNWHYAYPPTTVAMNYHLNKALGDNETGFRGTSDSTYRFEAWRFILAGGALFNHLDYSFATGHEEGNYHYDTTQPGGGSNALRSQIGYLKKFIESFDFINMKPDSTLINSGLTYSAISEKGKQYAVYFRNELNNQITFSIPDGKYTITWMHPYSGKYEKSVSVASKNDKLVLTVPEYTDDIAVKIIRKN
jgi:hypothetical protein